MDIHACCPVMCRSRKSCQLEICHSDPLVYKSDAVKTDAVGTVRRITEVISDRHIYMTDKYGLLFMLPHRDIREIKAGVLCFKRSHNRPFFHSYGYIRVLNVKMLQSHIS